MGLRRVETCSMPACQCGNPGSRSFTLTRGSESRARCSAWPVMIHGVLSFQIRTRETGCLAAASRKCSGGSNGQPASRLIGKNGVASVLVMPVPVASCACEEVISLLVGPVEVSPGSGSPAPGRPRPRAARRPSSSASGVALSSTTTPSSSRWSKTSGAAATHWPAAMHLSWSTATRMNGSPVFGRLTVTVTLLGRLSQLTDFSASAAGSAISADGAIGYRQRRPSFGQRYFKSRG